MKRMQLSRSICCFVTGIVLLALACVFDWPGQSFLCGMASGLTGAGGAMILRHLYWKQPKKQEKYAEMLNEQRINMQDERKIMLRDRSGRIVYQITIYLYCLLIIAAAVCIVADLFMPFAYYAVIALTLMLVFQYVCGIAVFRYLDRHM